MSSNVKLTPESAKDLLENDAQIWGANLKERKGYQIVGLPPVHTIYSVNSKTCKELCDDILAVYYALCREKHMHPVINIVRRDVEKIAKALFGNIPKEKWSPRSKLERIAFDAYLAKHHERPTKEQLQLFINEYNKEDK